MLALRTLGRALPKATLRQSATRSVSSITRPVLRTTAWQSTKKVAYPAFSTSIARREPAGEFDQELSAKIAQEHSLELETQDVSKNESVEEYLQTSPFTIIDKPGSHEIVLTRDFGNEKIKVELSISDINNIAEDEFDQGDEDAAFDDEAEFEDKRGLSQSRDGKADSLPEDGISRADRDADSEGVEYPSGPSYPISLLITITKPDNKAIQIAATAADGNIEVENLTIFQKASLVDADTGKDAREANAIYQGPPISNLDPELQLLLERYLEERGINAELAVFLPDYVDAKEQKEYVAWLENLQKFVDA